jgi:hypothetical protein
LFFPLPCSAEFVGKVLIKDNTLQLDDLLSVGIAWLLWIVLLRRLPGKFSLLAVVFAGMIAAKRLEPFRFEALPRRFGWFPFASFMQGSIAVNIQAFCPKFYEYGGLIWLLNRTGMGLPIGTLLPAALLLITSVAKCWLLAVQRRSPTQSWHWRLASHLRPETERQSAVGDDNERPQRIARFSSSVGPWFAPRRQGAASEFPREPGSLPRSPLLPPRLACAIPSPERRIYVRLVARIHEG